MSKDQVALMAHDKFRVITYRTGDAKHIIDSLPVKPPRKSPTTLMRNSIAEETEDVSPPGEGPAFRMFLTGLSWVVNVIAIGVAGLLTWAIGDGIRHYLAHQ